MYALVAGLIAAPVAITLLADLLFHAFALCFGLVDQALQERHWRARVKAQDLELLGRMLDQA